MNKVRIIRIVLSVVVFFAVFLALREIIIFSLEGELLTRAFTRIIAILIFSNAVIASFVFNIMFKMRFEKSRIKY
jgi:predicted membrane chloride channel (bestrophin family)